MGKYRIKMESLYCYKLDEETGEIIKITITPDQYELRKYTNTKYCWRININGYIHHCYEQDLDRFKTWKVYSFKDDIEAAREIFDKELKERRTKAQKEAERYHEVLDKMRRIEIKNI